MANSWLRLWHDMPNDPKWRTIARLSGQPVALVQATYVHLLVSASQGVTRGHADVTEEDLASALDVTDRDIALILDAMQGRVLTGSTLSGWEKRQVKRDDSGNPETGAMSATERKRAQRERQRLAKEAQVGHEGSRKVTPDKDKDKDKELKDKTLLVHGGEARQAPTEGGGDQSAAPPAKKTKGQDYPPEFETLWQAYPRRQGSNPKNKAFACWNARQRDGVAPLAMLEGVRRYQNFCQLSEKTGTEFVLQAQTFLGPRREFDNSWEITTGGNHVEFRYNPSDQRSYYEQFTEWEQLTGNNSAGMAAMGTDDQNLRSALDCQEWQSSIGPVDGSGQFDDE
ncbi:phage replisome organizer [Serratia marcescens]|uniref:phage replisome organizer n=1 Tax=Serratia marcescens TaxID=615 RepID=UPI001F2734B6|nr:phage replisome organizer [Serratia marcescens]